jgi:two-component sensor histidine kinase
MTVTEIALQTRVLNELTLLLELNRRIDKEFASAINLVAIAAVRSDNPEVKNALSNVVELLDEHAAVLRSLKIPDDDGLIDAAEYLGRLRQQSTSRMPWVRTARCVGPLGCLLRADGSGSLTEYVHELS